MRPVQLTAIICAGLTGVAYAQRIGAKDLYKSIQKCYDEGTPLPRALLTRANGQVAARLLEGTRVSARNKEALHFFLACVTGGGQKDVNALVALVARDRNPDNIASGVCAYENLFRLTSSQTALSAIMSTHDLDGAPADALAGVRQEIVVSYPEAVGGYMLWQYGSVARATARKHGKYVDAFVREFVSESLTDPGNADDLAQVIQALSGKGGKGSAFLRAVIRRVTKTKRTVSR